MQSGLYLNALESGSALPGMILRHGGAPQLRRARFQRWRQYRLAAPGAAVRPVCCEKSRSTGRTGGGQE